MNAGTKIASKLIAFKAKKMRLASKFDQKCVARIRTITLTALTAIIAVNNT